MPSNPKAISSSVRWAIEEANQELKLNNIKEARLYAKALQNLRQDYLGDLHKIIGQEKIQDYLGLHNERLKILREARSNLSRTSKGIEKLNRLRRQAIHKSDELIKGSGVDMDAVGDLQKQYAPTAL